MVHGQYSIGVILKIIIEDEFKDDYTTRIAGEKLRKMIVTAQGKVELDFSNLKIASASFFDEGIAKLSEENWDSQKINENLVFKNLFRRDRELLESVCHIRKIKIDFK